MSKYRRAAKIDSNQPKIVATLMSLGYSVQVGMDDILVGAYGKTYWYEIKEPSLVGKDGKIRPSAIKPSQKELLANWRGHYRIVWDVQQIIQEIKEDKNGLSRPQSTKKKIE